LSVFLKQQDVRKRRNWSVFLRRVERVSLSVLAVLAGLAALYGLYVLIFLGSYFSINDIVLQGHWKRLDAQQLIEVAGVKQGDNLFLMNVSEVHDRLMMHPWVREAAVRRHLPHTLLMAVEEFKPKAVYVRPDGMYYVDKEGVMFKRLDAKDDRGYFFITGLENHPDVLSGDDDRARGAIRKALGLGGALGRSKWGKKHGVAEVHYDCVQGFSVLTDAPATEILLGKHNLFDRVERVDHFAKAIRARQGRVQYILADEPGRVIVKYHKTKCRSAEDSKCPSV
jgi:cell division protein FtsQ